MRGIIVIQEGTPAGDCSILMAKCLAIQKAIMMVIEKNSSN